MATRGTAHPPRVLQAVLGALDVYKRVVVHPATPLVARPAPVRRTGFELDLVVDAVEPVAQDVVALTLRAPGGEPLPSWVPGAHLDVVLPSGRLRQYSLTGDPADRSAYRIAVRRLDDGDGGSVEVHGLAAGTPLRIRGPRNAFRLVEASSYLFVAGGIGITPVLPMVRAAAARGVPWRLVYVGRSRAAMPFLDELAALPGGVVELHCDDEHGFADVAAMLSGDDGDVYVCGPPPLMDAVRQVVRAVAPRTPLFSERFSALPVLGGEPFTVTLARSGRTVTVAADETALAAIRRELPDVRYSCRQGFCRSCRCGVLAGEVDHRDTVLLDAEREDSMLICVSRAAGSTLVLDL